MVHPSTPFARGIVSRFPQRIHNQLDLCRCKGPGQFRIADGAKLVHQVRIIVHPDFQFLSCGTDGDIRTIELCQFSLAIRPYFEKHFFSYEF